MTNLADIEQYFDKNGIPDDPWRIDKGSVCFNPALMVKTHIATLKRYSGNSTFLPYWYRLIRYYGYCKNR